jgi:hypothetical protein
LKRVSLDLEDAMRAGRIVIVLVAWSLLLTLGTAPDPAHAVTAPVRVQASTATFYPHADGYQDSVSIYVGALATPGDDVAGTLRIMRGSTVVKSWALTEPERHTIVWDGRVSGKPVYGTFTLVVDAVRSDGTIVSGTGSVVASQKKLVAKTWTTTKSAFLSSLSWCGWDLPQPDGVRCTFVHTYDFVRQVRVSGMKYIGLQSSSSAVSEWVTHGIPTPSSVRNSLAPVRVSVTANYALGGSPKKLVIVSCGVGSESDATYCGSESVGSPRTISTSGTHATRTSVNPDFEPTGSWVGWAVAPVGKSTAKVMTYTVKVTYYVLG